MIDAVQDKILTMLDALQNGVVYIAGQAVKYAPDVMDAALGVTRIDGIQSLVYGVISIIGIIFIVWVIKVARASDEPGFVIVSTIFGGLTGIFLSFVVLANLFSVWTWVQVFNPKLYIAHQIVQQVLK